MIDNLLTLGMYSFAGFCPVPTMISNLLGSIQSQTAIFRKKKYLKLFKNQKRHLSKIIAQCLYVLLYLNTVIAISNYFELTYRFNNINHLRRYSPFVVSRSMP